MRGISLVCGIIVGFWIPRIANLDTDIKYVAISIILLAVMHMIHVFQEKTSAQR